MTTNLATSPLEPTLLDELARRADRCMNGFDLSTQHPSLCACVDPRPVAPSEWDIFTSAVRSAAVGGVVHQRDVRPLIRGRILPKHIGGYYRRAKAEGLLVDTGDREPSDDFVGRNADKLDRVYRLAVTS